MRKSNGREIEEDSETIVVLGDKEQKKNLGKYEILRERDENDSQRLAMMQLTCVHFTIGLRRSSTYS